MAKDKFDTFMSQYSSGNSLGTVVESGKKGTSEMEHRSNGPAVQTVDADGKIINKMYVVNGIKLNEFEFEVFKASGKKNFL